MKFEKEEDLARVVVSHFEKLGYQVYKEVCDYGGGSARLDIYCVKDGDTIAIETKMSVGLTVIEQAYHWLGRVNRVYFAVPYKKKSNLYFVSDICRNFGIGIFLVNEPNQFRDDLIEWLQPPVCIEPWDPPKVFEEQKDSVAGNARGEFITPFRLTRTKLVDYVTLHPGCTMGEAVKNIKHHYQHEASAKSTLRRLILAGVIDEIKIEKQGKDSLLLLNIKPS
jgi:hypothetical protein